MTARKTAHLSRKQQVFCAEYIKCWSAAEAARRAGYSERSARTDGPRMLSNAVIRAEIDRHLADIQMSADEVKARLTDQARGDMSYFIQAGVPSIDLDKAEKAGKLHLVKSISHTVGEKTDTVKIELYDAQNALIRIGMMHGLFVERTEVTGAHGGPIAVDDARERLAHLIDSFAAQSTTGTDTGRPDAGRSEGDPV